MDKTENEFIDEPVPTAAEIIDALGGPTKVAKLCKTTPQNVWHWKHGNKGSEPRIPQGYLMYLQAVRPDVFDLTVTRPVPLTAARPEP